MDPSAVRQLLEGLAAWPCLETIRIADSPFDPVVYDRDIYGPLRSEVIEELLTKSQQARELNRKQFAEMFPAASCVEETGGSPTGADEDDVGR